MEQKINISVFFSFYLPFSATKYKKKKPEKKTKSQTNIISEKCYFKFYTY